MILEIIRTIIARQHLERVAAVPATLTVAQAAADIRTAYVPTARGIADKLALLEKTQAQIDAATVSVSLLVADSIFYSDAVNARVAGGDSTTAAVASAYTADADAARKARWTLPALRALFGA